MAEQKEPSELIQGLRADAARHKSEVVEQNKSTLRQIGAMEQRHAAARTATPKPLTADQRRQQAVAEGSARVNPTVFPTPADASQAAQTRAIQSKPLTNNNGEGWSIPTSPINVPNNVAGKNNTSPVNVRPSALPGRLAVHDARYGKGPTAEQQQAAAKVLPNTDTSSSNVGVDRFLQSINDVNRREIISQELDPVKTPTGYSTRADFWKTGVGKGMAPVPLSQRPKGRNSAPQVTRGHVSTQQHLAQLRQSAEVFGVPRNFSTRGEIRGLSRDTPAEPPVEGVRYRRGTEPAGIKRGQRVTAYEHPADIDAPRFRSGRVPADTSAWAPVTRQVGRGDESRMETFHRPPLLPDPTKPHIASVLDQDYQIATPGGVDRGPDFARDMSKGARGEFSGLNQQQLQDAVDLEMIPDAISQTVQTDLMKHENAGRKVKPSNYTPPTPFTDKQREAMSNVKITYTKGRKSKDPKTATETMSETQHAERAERKKEARENRARRKAAKAKEAKNG